MKSSNHVIYFLLQISSPLAIDTSVEYFTRDASAIAGQDYLSTSGTAIIRAGETRTEIAVEIIGDTVNEGSEVFYLVITNPQGASFPDGITEIVASRTIVNDD